MAHTALTPVFVGLRTGLHGLFLALSVLVIARAVFAPTDNSSVIVVLSVALVATYALGGLILRSARLGRRGLLWLAVLSLEWAALL